MVATIKAQAAVANIELEQGTTFDRTITYRDSASNPIDLTGYTARMKIKEYASDTSPLLELTTENSKIVLGGAAGTIRLIITDTETASFTFDEALYDLELIDGSSNVSRLLKGKIILLEEVTD